MFEHKSLPYTVTPKPATKILAVLASQNFTPGASTQDNATVRFGWTPWAHTVNTSLSVRLIAVDNYYNKVPSVTGTVTFSSTDGVATYPAAANLVSGEVTLVFTPKVSGNHTHAEATLEDQLFRCCPLKRTR